MNQKGSALIVVVIVILSIIILLLAAGLIGLVVYFIYQDTDLDPRASMQNEDPIITNTVVIEKMTDEMEDILLDLIKDTNYDFSTPVEGTFDWRTEELNESFEYDGYVTELKNVTFDDAMIIDEYFEDQGFSIDPYNAADGTVASLHGYRKGDIACPIGWSYHGDAFEGTVETLDIDISCGEIN